MIALSLALALQSSTAAAAPPAPPAPAPVAAKPAEDKMECHEEATTGSHFSSRTCHRHSEWARMHDESLGELNRRGRNTSPSGLAPR